MSHGDPTPGDRCLADHSENMYILFMLMYVITAAMVPSI